MFNYTVFEWKLKNRILTIVKNKWLNKIDNTIPFLTDACISINEYVDKNQVKLWSLLDSTRSQIFFLSSPQVCKKIVKVSNYINKNDFHDLLMVYIF